LKSDSPVGGERAPAKINLALHVLGRRPDRYHDIDSLVVFADIADEIEARSSDGGLTLVAGGPFAGSLGADDTDNLAMLAATKLAAAADANPDGTALRLTKNLPVAAGLGGGSADAAAVLRLLNRYWQLGRAPDELRAIGDEIGADVPMCVASVPARATGRGERLTEIDGFPALAMVLVFPGVGVATAAVFARTEAGRGERLPRLPLQLSSAADVAAWLRQTRNGLQDAAIAEAPIIRDALTALTDSRDCLIARMSGSGSTCFGLFPSEDAAKRAAGAIRAKHPSWWVKPTTTAGS
jgi:4-diphosphocytidyl-2-C-methyl-D-erythritol kinase